MARHHATPNGNVPFTAEEEVARDAEEAAQAAKAPARAWQTLRDKRDQLLTETDWVVTMHKELGTNISSAWKTYRQALRDLPANTSDPTDVTWPTKPS